MSKCFFFIKCYYQKHKIFRGTSFFGVSNESYFNAVLLKSKYYYLEVQFIVCSELISHFFISDLYLITKKKKSASVENFTLLQYLPESFMRLASSFLFCIPFLKKTFISFMPQYLYLQYYPFISTWFS